jgi:hypothetical protein
MTTQESTSRDIVGESYKSDMVHTSPTRKQRVQSNEKVDKLHAFRHWRLEYSLIPTICYGFKMSGK